MARTVVKSVIEIHVPTGLDGNSPRYERQIVADHHAALIEEAIFHTFPDAEVLVTHTTAIEKEHSYGI